MKRSAEHARRLKRLFSQIKKDGSVASLVETDDPMRVLLLGIYSNFASEQRAAGAVERLLDAVVDINELRVTPVADLVQIVGVDYPNGRCAAEEASRVLNSIFNRTHDLDLRFLKTAGKKTAEAFLDSLDGLGPHAKAFFQQRYLSVRTIPLDANMHAYLQRSDCIEQEAGVAEAQRFLTSVIRDRDAASFYSRFKRFAAAHAARRPAARTAVRESPAAVSGRAGPTEEHQRTDRKPAAARRPTRKKRAARGKTTKARRSTSGRR